MQGEALLASYLIVIYGSPPADTGGIAAGVAASLPGKSAVVSVAHLLEQAIVQPANDAEDELEMVYVQTRLLVANYMKNGYHVVVEGPFYHQRGGRLHRYEQEIDQLVALMRQMTRQALTVHLADSRADPATPDSAGIYRQRYGARALSFDAGVNARAEIADAICERLLAEEFA